MVGVVGVVVVGVVVGCSKVDSYKERKTGGRKATLSQKKGITLDIKDVDRAPVNQGK